MVSNCVLNNLLKNAQNTNIIETIADFQFHTYVSSMDFDINAIIGLFKDIPQRDVLNIIFTHQSNVLSIVNSSSYDNVLGKLNDMKEEIESGDLVKISVIITKSIQWGKFSVYSIVDFTKWLFLLDFESIIESCNSFKKKELNCLNVICYNDTVSLRTGYFNFVEAKYENDIIYNCSNSKKVLEERSNICNIETKADILFTPDDFNPLCNNNTNVDLQCKFRNVSQVLSLIYLAEYCKLAGNELHIILNGHRTIDESINIKVASVSDAFFEVYRWLYTDGNIYDKYEIVKNVISLKCKNSSILNVGKETMAAIKSNYNLYMKENVKDYLALKQCVASGLQTFCNNIGDIVTRFGGFLKGNLFAAFGYIATLIFAKGIEETGSQFKVEDFSLITSFVITGSLIFGIVSLFEVLAKKNYYNKCIEALKGYHADIFQTDELCLLVDENPILKAANKHFVVGVIVTSILWLVMIIGVFILLDFLSGDTMLLYVFNFF